MLSGKRCLVVEDESLIAVDIQQELEAVGAAQVVCAPEPRGGSYGLARSAL
jgi:hypothetical protein